MRLFKSYDTPGKGVSKNEREKRGFFRFFELYGRNFWMFVSAEFWYFLLSLPLITSGLANVGLAYLCRMAARDKHVFMLSDFFGTIKKNWKRALPLGIINLIINIFFFGNFYVLYIWMSQGIINKVWGGVILAVTAFLFVLYSFAKYYQYTLMITFDFKLGTIIKNSLLFATLGIKHNLIIGGVMLLIYALAYLLLCISIRYGVAIIIVIGVFPFPPFKMFLVQFNVFPEIKRYIIDPYYKEHPDEDIEKRRDLGILDDDTDDAVFDDEQGLKTESRETLD